MHLFDHGLASLGPGAASLPLSAATSRHAVPPTGVWEGSPSAGVATKGVAVISIRGLFSPRGSGFADRVPGLGDGYDPEQERLLAEARSRAEADAVRNAEEMVGREFPIVAEAEQIIGRRFAELERFYAGTRAELEAELRCRAADLEAAEAQLRITERALIEGGVPQPQVGLAPLGRRFFAYPRDREERRLALLRRNRRREARAVADARAAVEEVSGQLERLRREVRAGAESEVALASELVATYVGAVFSSLPVGVLADGRELAEQRQPDVGLPDWVPARAEA
jgi:hypothetical protein